MEISYSDRKRGDLNMRFEQKNPYSKDSVSHVQ